MSDAGRIRLQFTSPAKPALISWIDGDATAGASSSLGPGPLGSPDGAKTGSAEEAAEADAGLADTVDARLADTAAFRYLVVPLRVPTAG